MRHAIRTCQQIARQHDVHSTCCSRNNTRGCRRLWQQLSKRDARCASSSSMHTCPPSPMGISGDRMGESFLRA